MVQELWGTGSLGIAYNGRAAGVWVAFPLCADNDNSEVLKRIQAVTARHIATGFISTVRPYPVQRTIIAGYDAKYTDRLLFWVEQVEGKYNLTMPTSPQCSYPNIANLDDLANTLQNTLKKLDPATSTKISLVSALT